MSLNYIRYYSVTCSGSGGSQTFTDPGDPNNPQLRCRFEIHRRTAGSPGTAKILITNPLRDHAKQFLQKEYTHVTVDAGYVDHHALLFSGTIVQSIYGRENPTDTLLQVLCGDGDWGHNNATVNTTVPPGSTPQQHFNIASQALAKYGIGVGYIGVDLSTPTYSRAVTLWGMARDVLYNIAKFKMATFSYQKEKITMIQKGAGGPGGAIVLNSQTGLVGMPAQTLYGIMARCLINPAIDIFSMVQIDQALIAGGLPQVDISGRTILPGSETASITADGIYSVRRMDIFGDSRGNPWYMDLTLVSLTGKYTTGTGKTLTDTAPQPPYVGSP